MSTTTINNDQIAADEQLRETVEFRPMIEFLKEFKIGKIVGSGSYGIVRKCKHRKTKRAFALKSVSARDKRIRDEASVLLNGVLSHENIVKCHAAYESEDEIHLLFDYCQGGDVQRFMDDMTLGGNLDMLGHFGLAATPLCRNLPGEEIEKKVRTIIAQLLEAVRHCHGVVGIAHRDIKPANVLLRERCYHDDNGKEPHVQLIDFGFAKSIDESKSSRVGTLAYAAPEVMFGDKDCDVDLKAADMWSVGIVSYALLYGRPPFVGEDEKETSKNVCEAKLEFTEDFDYSCQAKEFISSLLQLDASLRPTAKEMLQHPWLRSSPQPKSKHPPRASIFLDEAGESSTSIGSTVSTGHSKPGLFKLFTRRRRNKTSESTGPPVSNQ